MSGVELVAINQTGELPIQVSALPQTLRDNCRATAAFYKVVGFEPPWIGYVSLSKNGAVGGGAFKGAPRDNRIEIAYYTLTEFEGRGFATATARELVAMAKAAVPGIVVAAQTLPTPNASNALLKKLGFTFKGSVLHPEDGEVWEWQLNAQQAVPADGPASRARS